VWNHLTLEKCFFEIYLEPASKFKPYLLDTFLDVELFNFTQFLNIMQLGCLFWNPCNFLKWSAVMVDGITKYPMIPQDILIAFGSLNIFLQKN